MLRLRFSGSAFELGGVELVALRGPQRRLGRQVLDEDAEPPPCEAAARSPQVPQIRAVAVKDQVGLYRFLVFFEERDEALDSPWPSP